MSQGGPNSSAGTGANPVETLTANSGGAVSPDGAMNIDILGNNATGIDIVGNPASNLLSVMGISSTTTQIGTVELATDAEAVAASDTTRAITPSDLGPVFASPPAIGGTAANTADFTDLYASNHLYVGASSPSNPYNIAIEASTAGLIGQSIQNTSNNAAAGSNLQIIVETGAADAFTYYGVNSTTDWAMGIDNSDSDSLKIAAGITPSGTNTWTMTTSGERTMPLQPAFLAHLGSNDLNQTGDGTIFYLGNTDVGTALTIDYDQNSDFTSGASGGAFFTAPVTGRYFFQAMCRLSGVTSAMTNGHLTLVTTSNTVRLVGDLNYGALLSAGTPYVGLNGSIIIDMDATDTAKVYIVLGNGTKVADINGAAVLVTYFCGNLVC